MNGNLTPPPERDFPETQLRMRKEQLLSAIKADQGRRPLRRRLHRRSALAFGVAACAVAAAAAAILPATGGGPGSASAAVFNRLANRVAAQSWTPGPGQYLYEDTESEWGAFSGNCETRSVERDQIWVGADGSGLDRETKQPGTFTSPADRATCLSMAKEQATIGYTLAARSSDDWFAPNCMDYGQNTDWSRFSSDPQALLQQIDQLYHSANPTPSQEFNYIEEMLGQSNPPPDVQANIYRAAALIPGVQSLGTVQDHAGRSGLGLSISLSPPAHYDSTAPYGTSEVIFDAQTGELLGQTDTGQLAGWNVYLHKDIVNQLPADPPVPLTPACTTTGGGTIQQIPGGSVMTGKS
jgi:hypothetical protein